MLASKLNGAIHYAPTDFTERRKTLISERFMDRFSRKSSEAQCHRLTEDPKALPAFMIMVSFVGNTIF